MRDLDRLILILETANGAVVSEAFAADCRQAAGRLIQLRGGLVDLIIECAGPDATGQRHLCRDCGHDLSMRGPQHEAEEHARGCPVGRACRVLAATDPHPAAARPPSPGAGEGRGGASHG